MKKKVVKVFEGYRNTFVQKLKRILSQSFIDSRLKTSLTTMSLPAI